MNIIKLICLALISTVWFFAIKAQADIINCPYQLKCDGQYCEGLPRTFSLDQSVFYANITFFYFSFAASFGQGTHCIYVNPLLDAISIGSNVYNASLHSPGNLWYYNYEHKQYECYDNETLCPLDNYPTRK